MNSKSFGQSNGPFICKVQKEDTEFYQGNDSTAVCYLKIKTLRDELTDLSEVLDYSCPNTRKAIKKTI